MNKNVILLSISFLARLAMPLSASVSPAALNSPLYTANPEPGLHQCVSYWCPTNNGSEWTELRIRGMEVLSIRKFRSVAMEPVITDTSPHSSVTQKGPGPITSPLTETAPKPAQSITVQAQLRSLEQPFNRNVQTANNNTTVRSPYSSIEGNRYHTIRQCPSGVSIQRENRVTYISSREAEKAGLSQCRRCLFIQTTQ